MSVSGAVFASARALVDAARSAVVLSRSNFRSATILSVVVLASARALSASALAFLESASSAFAVAISAFALASIADTSAFALASAALSASALTIRAFAIAREFEKSSLALFAAASANACADLSATCAALVALATARSDFSPAIIPVRSETVNLAITDFTGAARPVTAVTDARPVATTVTSPATPATRAAVTVPRTAPVEVLVAVAVVRDLVTERSANAEPIKVTVAVSETEFPNTSVVVRAIVGTVPTAVAEGTDSPRLYAAPAVPEM